MGGRDESRSDHQVERSLLGRRHTWLWGEFDVGEIDAIEDEIRSKPGAKGRSAVRDGRVYIIFAPILFGLDNVAGLGYLAELLHPEIDLFPRCAVQEYLDRRGLDLPLDLIFIYSA